ncbi:MAG: hypothetical protein JNM43_26090 [Planctomycetaceae bacterium]|nr:hypothetical protein [Planctomycetaceae bacterium]
MVRLLLGLGVLGAVFTFMGFRDFLHASKAGAEPDKLTAAQLIARGAEGNPYVEISDFMTGDNFVYEEENGRWNKVWIPFGDFGEMMNPGTPVKGVMKSNRVKSQMELEGEFGKPVIRGMVMNAIESLGSEEKKILSGSYPGSNLDNLIIVDVSKDPVAMRQQGLTFGGIGLVALVACGGGGFYMYKKR